MERDVFTLGHGLPGAEVLDEREVQSIFGLHSRGWTLKAIARELGLARNTVRKWLRRGPEAPRPVTGRPPSLSESSDWLRERFLAGVRNGDVLRQELAERGTEVSLRTVQRFVEPLRAEAISQDRATLRFETPPGRQMQIDFGEKWIEVAAARLMLRRHGPQLPQDDAALRPPREGQHPPGEEPSGPGEQEPREGRMTGKRRRRGLLGSLQTRKNPGERPPGLCGGLVLGTEEGRHTTIIGQRGLDRQGGRV